jgi:hypothetical protein
MSITTRRRASRKAAVQPVDPKQEDNSLLRGADGVPESSQARWDRLLRNIAVAWLAARDAEPSEPPEGEGGGAR